jgi:hypothetical protein
VVENGEELLAPHEILLRRIYTEDETTGEDGTVRLKKWTFQDGKEGCSVHRALKADREQIRRDHPGCGFAAIKVQDVLDAGDLVIKPCPTDKDPSHCLIKPPPGGGPAAKAAKESLDRAPLRVTETRA